MKYKILEKGSAEQLQEEVNRLINEGYEPIGGVSVAILNEEWENSRKGHVENSTIYCFCQAMVKKNC